MVGLGHCKNNGFQHKGINQKLLLVGKVNMSPIDALRGTALNPRLTVDQIQMDVRYKLIFVLLSKFLCYPASQILCYFLLLVILSHLSVNSLLILNL